MSAMHTTLTPQREKYFLLTLAGIQFSHILDFMIMMPLGPILMAEFGIGTHEFGLLVASYSFSAAFCGFLAATFIDRFERKRLVLLMFALFSIATLACGLAPGYVTLLVARGLAGAFGGVLGALVQTMVGDVIPFARRARASGIVSTAFSVSTVAGVPLSLWLANHLQWRAPFVFIAALVIIFIFVGYRFLPELRHHISSEKRAHPFSAMFEVLRDANHLRALFYSSLIIFSGFTVIPYITVYAVGNVGIAQADIPLIYLAGGAATFFSARLIGHWADKHGKVGVYRIIAVAAMLPLIVVTHLGAAPLWAWLICTTAFFSSSGVAFGWSYIQCHVPMSTRATPAISYVPQKSLSVFSASPCASGRARPSSSRSRCWKTKASASVKAVLGTPWSRVWSIRDKEKTCSTLCPISCTAMLYPL